MGVLDFLKITVWDRGNKKKSPAATPKRSQPSSCIEFDSKSFPLAAITTKGFIAGNFDDSLIRGQKARITVKVADEYGKFSFPATVLVNDVKDGKLIGEWNMLSAEIDATIRQYNQIRKQKSGR